LHDAVLVAAVVPVTEARRSVGAGVGAEGGAEAWSFEDCGEGAGWGVEEGWGGEAEGFGKGVTRAAGDGRCRF